MLAKIASTCNNIYSCGFWRVAGVVGFSVVVIIVALVVVVSGAWQVSMLF